METGAVRMGAGELVASKMWDAIAAPALDYDPLVTISVHANTATLAALAPLGDVTKAARKAATGGREHCHSAARMATGILNAESRRSTRCATAVARIMRKPNTGVQKKVLRHIAGGTAGCKRAQKALAQVARNTGTAGVIAGWRKPSSVNARGARKICVMLADAKARRAAREHSHTKESLELYESIRKVHGTGVLPRKILRGDYCGQLMHQQIRASATYLNAYTGRHGRVCTHTRCLQRKETNKHAVVECGRYATARQQFALETGITITSANYVDVMALNAKKLNIAPDTLSTALCRLLAHIMKKHRKENNNNASVAIPLECNQRRSIIRVNRSEQAPD